jgi:multiple sugar transport system ATP-binding protein
MARIALEHVDKTYPNGYVAARDLSLEAADGELLVLVGPSGSGKSTVLRLMAGLERVTDGVIRIGDRDVTDLPPQQRDIAMVFQNYALYPHMTVRDNLAFGLNIRKQPRDMINSRVNAVAASLGLESLLERKPAQLSGGQRQRVALGRAIVREPLAFLFDEPLSNLDAQLRVETRVELSRLHRKLGATMVYVTHDQSEALTLGDRIAVLKEGVLQQIATPMELYEKPANKFVAGFIGSPAMNFVDGTITKSDTLEFVAEGNAFTFGVPPALAERIQGLEGRPLTLGIRPEDVSVVIESGPTIFLGESTIVHPPITAPACLDLVEALGNEVFVYATVGAYSITARIAPQPLPALAKPITLAFDLAKAHFFDRETGDRVGKG